MIGGGIGGLYLGITRVARFAAGSPGLLVLPAYIPTADVAPLGYTMANLVNAVIGVVIAMAVAFAASYILFGVWAKKGKLDPAELGKEEAPAPAADHADDEIVAVANGKFLPAEKLSDPMFADQSMGQTVGIDPTDGKIVSPANGTLEMVFETGHAFSVRMKDGTGLLIHIGVDTVNLNGKGFKVLKKQGDTVKAGEAVVEADLKVIKDAGLSAQTMIVISEPSVEGQTAKFIEFGPVKAGQKINK